MHLSKKVCCQILKKNKGLLHVDSLMYEGCIKILSA